MPPSSWSLFRWLRTPAPQFEVHDDDDPSGTRKGDAKKSATDVKAEEPPPARKEKDDLECRTMPPPAMAKAESDRKAMPPPSFKKPSLPASRSQVTTAPSPSPAANAGDAFDPPPSFPALNSAQRASGGRNSTYLAPSPAQPPLRNPLLAPPLRSPQTLPLPNRTPNSLGPPPTAKSLFPPPTHTAIPSKPSKKVLLRPGHSPLDWAHLSSTSANLNGLPSGTPYIRVPPSLLRHYTGRKGKDAWTVLGGKVYNITPYLPYHPGGEAELLRCAGRDGTRLFGEVHPWVNWEGMLESCLVGIAVGEEEIVSKGEMEEMD